MEQIWPIVVSVAVAALGGVWGLSLRRLGEMERRAAALEERLRAVESAWLTHAAATEARREALREAGGHRDT